MSTDETTQPPRVSVVIPVEDHRGMLLKAIHGWRQQTLPAGAAPVEIVIVSSGAEPLLDREVAELLRPCDQLVVAPGANIAASYNAGAERARGDLLLMTEAHCVARPDCAEKLVAFFDREPVEAACLHSDCFPGPRFAVAEQTLFQRAFVARSADDGWNKVTIRGFAIRRATFLKHRFAPEFELFAQLDLGIRLHAAGTPMGYAREASVTHYNTDSPAELLRNLVIFGRGEIFYRATHDDALAWKYLGACPEWDRRELARSEHARAHLLGLGRAALDSLRQGQIAWARRLARVAAKQLPAALLGPRWLEIKSRLELAIAQGLRRFTPGRGEWYTAAYGRYWGRALRYARHITTAQWLREHAVTTAISDFARPSAWIGAGLRPVATNAGREFRWTDPVSFFVLASKRAETLTLVTTGARPMQELAACRAFVDGRPLPPPRIDAACLALHFDLPIAARGKSLLRLTLICPPTDGNQSNGDAAAWGLPLRAIELNRGATNNTAHRRAA